MTNKSVSEQICEICGIKPVIKPIILTFDGRVIQRQDGYPDFENPKNFKKLFNLKYGQDGHETVIARFCKCHFQVKNTTEFLEKFLDMLKYDQCDATELIIKEIKKTSWEI